MALPFMPEINTALCDGCGRCVRACSAGALALAGGRAALTRPDLCQWDTDCELACPAGAIRVPLVVVFGDDVSDNSHG